MVSREVRKNMNIGEKIKRRREELGITQRELAIRVGITEATLSRYENGIRIPNAQILAKLAEALQTDLNYFTDGLPYNQFQLTGKDKKDIAIELERMISELENADALAFYNEPLDEESKEYLKNALRIGLEIAKLKNKEKFTPKKYR